MWLEVPLRFPAPLLVALVACRADPEPEPIAVVPEPALVRAGEGAFVFGPRTRIDAGPGTEPVAGQLAEELRGPLGLELPFEASDRDRLSLRLEPGSTPPEGYVLDVDADGVRVVASDLDGLYWGGQTLRMLLPPEALADAPAADVDWVVPAVHVEDEPRFAWRGLMLDVARHFSPVADVERQIDLMALHKLNRLHLHLTDDQGWRLEITSWPELGRVGGASEVGGGPGGYYTQEDYLEIVAYAADRRVVVVPELDMPGHCNAATVAYPELAIDGIAPDPYTGVGPFSGPLWVDGAATDGFVRDVWREVAALTPGPWVHIGGDEAVGIEPAEYGAFVVDVVDVVAAEGAQPIAWDEAVEADLGDAAVVQWWIDEDRAAAATQAGAGVIASPAGHAYFDMIYDADADFGQIWAGPVNLERAYDWDPEPGGFADGGVIGVEGALWTELVGSREQADFMLWPRSAALAEVGWSQTSDWSGFAARMPAEGERLDALGVGFYRTPEVEWR